MARRRKIIAYGIGGFLTLFAILYLFPYIWMVSMSAKPDGEIYSGKIFPENPTLEQYQRLFYGYKSKDIILKVQYAVYYKNTAIITVISLVLILFLDAMAAYGFAKFEFRGKTV